MEKDWVSIIIKCFIAAGVLLMLGLAIPLIIIGLAAMIVIIPLAWLLERFRGPQKEDEWYQ